MAVPATLPALLTTLTDSLNSATSSLPSTTNLAPPSDGISLLDTKNELLLSYLHNLVFLIILKLRPQSSPTMPAEEPSLDNAVTEKLVELRIYLEKGVRPLESRLKYQLDKLLLAAASETSSSIPSLPNGTAQRPNASERRTANSDTSANDADAEQPAPQPTRIPDLAHRPNPSAFARPSSAPKNNTRPSAASSSSDAPPPYRPPRITPTALLPTTADSNPRRKKDNMKARKSRTLDEFVREEMDDGAPVAEPSIGAGSGLRGREREREEERKGYEEMRLVRLPEEKGGKKKTMMMKRRGGEGFGEDLLVGGLGGFEFEGLKGRGGMGKRKRERDGGGEEGGRVGQAWEKRVKRGVGRKRR